MKKNLYTNYSKEEEKESFPTHIMKIGKPRNQTHKNSTNISVSKNLSKNVRKPNFAKS